MDIFVARQPIFDVQNRLFGYELLYRGNAMATGAAGASVNQMSSQVIVRSLVDLGMEQITGPRLGFLNFSREMLVGGYWDLLDPNGVVVELLEVIEPDLEVIESCERLCAAGYTLALDDFVYTPRHEPLLELASIVKLDVLDTPLDDVQKSLDPLSRHKLRLLAERVENAEIHAACAQMGFELFQGYFYSRPETVSGKEMPADQLTIFRLMSLIRDDETSESALEEAFRGDLGLSYKLLRIVNSAAVGGRGIESIRHAIQLLGRAALARWLGLLMVVSLSNRSGTNEQLSETAIARARFCEQLALATGKRAASSPYFMLGLFSLLDRLMAMPMEEILDRLDLATEIRDALLSRTGPYAPALEVVESYEAGDWERARSTASLFNLPGEKLVELYIDALGWARDRMAEAMAR